MIHAESCYQEDGEEVRRQEAREEVRPQGRREEGDAQRRGEEGLREEVLREKDGGEEVREGKKAAAKKSAAKRAPAKRKKATPMPTPDRQTRRRPPDRLARSDVSADQARLPAVRPRLISLFVLCVRN